ncbi:hypothetical protein ED236_09255 [Pseudomethylobacillus aquaticus]|uniref:Uncharacterized protein n=1 Tax=Pseudomethylobacillus aquaticus TaxID=2676064 RepID=A0A3N0UZD7_9PROT|nr:hypothetical protein [Pseudomethylobacillus aquaticus]ROH85907.1 hypothetical protein ED236_09255 [Pseudomethylobacillus aquaticus]
MTHVEQALTFTPTQGGSQATQGRSDKQAWLYSLEKTGLSEALSKTKIVPGLEQRAQNHLPESQANLPTQKVSQSGLSEASVQVNSPPTIHASAGLEKVAAHPSLEHSTTKLLDQSLAVPALSQVPVKLADAAIGDISMRYWFNLLKPTAEWSLKNMLALNSSQGVEVWVRDPDLDSETRIRAFLKDLNQTMGSLGASLVRVVINGQQRYLLNQPQHTSLRSHDGR